MEYVALMGQKHTVSQENLNDRNHLKDIGIHAQITLPSILKKMDGCVLGSFGAGQGTVTCETSN